VFGDCVITPLITSKKGYYNKYSRCTLPCLRFCMVFLIVSTLECN